jgi:hypothetical protein
MKVIGQDVEVINLCLKSFRVKILQILILSRQDDRKTTGTERLTELDHEIDLVALVDCGIAAAALSTRPLPVNVNTLKVPLVKELQERSDEGGAV